MFPLARTFPVGEIPVPPVIEIAPPEVSAPAPLYAPVKEIEIGPLATTGLANVTKPPVVVTSTDPPDDVIAALVAVVIWPEPRRTTLLVAWIAPVGSTLVPPVIRTVPAEAVRAPAPM
jgi:hypothetical protein